MDRRLKFQKILEDILGSRNVYFQPPESIKMRYPAIVYSLDSVLDRFANNVMYSQTKAYKVVLIDEDPDSEIIDKLKALPLSHYRQHYVSDNLNHDAFTIYY